MEVPLWFVRRHIKAFLFGVKVSEMSYFYKDLLTCGFGSIFWVLLLTVAFLFFSFLFLNQSNFLTMVELDSVQLSSLLSMKNTRETLSLEKKKKGKKLAG